MDDGGTALRTLEIGTKGCMAPELFGLSNDEGAGRERAPRRIPTRSTYGLLSGKGCFEYVRSIGAYVYKDEPFPTSDLPCWDECAGHRLCEASHGCVAFEADDRQVGASPPLAGRTFLDRRGK
jgi:hypothetical protein